MPRSPDLRLGCERLEDRSTPAQFGVPWTDPTHLTLSFAPDGTAAAGQASGLFAALDVRMPRAVWQGAILRAFQTWADAANVDVGVTADGGQGFGTSGAAQGDPRFGDIRVGGFPMTAAALAVASPPAPFLSGTLAGDLFVNTAAALTPDALYAVALHEAGHALGLSHSGDPKSVMFSELNRNAALAAGDVAAVRALYGPRAADPNEGDKGNDTAKNATRLKYPDTPGEYTGAAPVVGYGDIARGDADVFALRQLAGYSGPITFRAQTAGISLLAPSVTVTDSAGKVLGQATASDSAGSSLAVTLPTTKAGETYYVRVTAATGAANVVGRYAVAATFDANLRPTAFALDRVMRGPYEALSPGEQQKLFADPNRVLFGDDEHSDDTAALAANLRVGPANPSEFRLQTTASLADGTDVDWYRVRAPQSATRQPWVLTASVRAVSPNGAAPRVEVSDGNLRRVPATVLVNGDGTYTVQATGVPPNGSYFLRVFSPTATGNYALDATFGTAAADVKPLASATLAGPGSAAAFRLYVGQTQFLSSALSVAGAAGGVRMDVLNSAGALVQSLTAAAGDTASGVGALLPPGEYTVWFTAVGTAGPVSLTLRGSGLTDPIGPVKDSTTLTPLYQSPSDPGLFKYPGTTAVTTNPYLFLFWFFA